MSKRPGPLTPKAISNRIKAKGLQKLRWYCQMCQKQCRDDNGFKCHLMSEAHQRQLLIFADNPGRFIYDYSKEFLRGYLDLIKRQFGGRRVHCNVVYQEYIKDKEHIHMNSTRWHSLTGLVQWLGREGICRVDETEKGWFVQYIEKDPEGDRKRKDKERMELTDNELQQQLLEQQMERDRQRLQSSSDNDFKKPTSEFTELKRDESSDKITLGINLKKATSTLSDNPTSSLIAENALARAAKEAKERKLEKLETGSCVSSSSTSSSKKRAIQEIMDMQEQEKECKNRRKSWLVENIMVKLIDKSNSDLYKQKGVITKLSGSHTAFLKLIDSNKSVMAEQRHLQTVLPALGGQVLVVNGAYRGCVAILEGIDVDSFSCSIRISKGISMGRVLNSVSYDDVCKLYQSDS